ncbi:hypothetical protein DRF58_12240 [Epilithonimonas hispanica]|uniref:Uncharacterized protein n=1 Tax=Epilithonimonas hispanica TaxID=358687 RepID=A0A3D9CVP1_9FLAO|nr:hypothetical protein DRF58_12240 [Epilithonimonas hispanica]
MRYRFRQLHFSVDENSKKITTKNAQNDVLVYTISSLSDKELILLNTEGGDTTKYTLTKRLKKIL